MRVIAAEQAKTAKTSAPKGYEVKSFLVPRSLEIAWPELIVDSFCDIIDDTATERWKSDGEWVCVKDCAH